VKNDFEMEINLILNPSPYKGEGLFYIPLLGKERGKG